MRNFQLIEETKKFYSDDILKAEKQLEEIKVEFGEKVVKSLIEKKCRKGVEYFLLTVVIAHDSIKDITDEIYEMYK